MHCSRYFTEWSLLIQTQPSEPGIIIIPISQMKQLGLWEIIYCLASQSQDLRLYKPHHLISKLIPHTDALPLLLMFIEMLDTTDDIRNHSESDWSSEEEKRMNRRSRPTCPECLWQSNYISPYVCNTELGPCGWSVLEWCFWIKIFL